MDMGKKLGLNQAYAQINAASSPTQVGTDTTWTSHYQIVNYSSAAIKTDGTLWTWGSNYGGSLGLNAPHPGGMVSSPTQVGTATNWASLNSGSEGYKVMGAINTDGELYTWGRGNYGELGNNSSYLGGGTWQLSSPTQIPGTTWSVVRGGNERTFAGKTDGTLWYWGSNQYGQLGLNQAGSYPSGAWRQSPTQVGTSTDWNVSTDTMTTGDKQTLVIKTDGTLWGWGGNYYGELGLNTGGSPARISSPAQIGTETTWSKISAGAYNTFGLKTDGSMWGWGSGSNTYTSAVGWNQTIDISSPIQISGTWTAVTGMRQNAMGIKEG